MSFGRKKIEERREKSGHRQQAFMMHGDGAKTRGRPSDDGRNPNCRVLATGLDRRLRELHFERFPPLLFYYASPGHAANTRGTQASGSGVHVSTAEGKKASLKTCTVRSGHFLTMRHTQEKKKEKKKGTEPRFWDGWIVITVPAGFDQAGDALRKK